MKLPITLVALFTLLPLFNDACSAQEKTTSEKSVSATLEEYFSHLEKNNQFMGSVTVLKDGNVVFNQAFGQRSLTEAGDPVLADPQTSYGIGSITKMFTSVLINQMVDAGQISLDDKLSKFFPDVIHADQITIDQLLRHRSGLKNITATPDYPAWSRQPQTRQAMLERIEKLPADFPAGEKTEYSNTNFLLLGYLVEKISGQSFAEVLKEKITAPLGMTRTFFEPAAAIKNNADSFRHLNEWIKVPPTDPSVPHAAGVIVSTSGDLATFISGLFAGKLVSSASLGRLTDTSGGMGQGMMAFPFGRKRALGHGGAIDGFRSNLAFFPDEDVVVAICSNGLVYPLNQVTIGALTRVFELPAELPSFAAAEVSEQQLRLYEGTYAAENFPLKITIAVDGDGKLTGQATGQSAFPLTAKSDTDFRFDAAQIRMKFFESAPGKGYDRIRFQQGPMKQEFKKQAP